MSQLPPIPSILPVVSPPSQALRRETDAAKTQPTSPDANPVASPQTHQGGTPPPRGSLAELTNQLTQQNRAARPGADPHAFSPPTALRMVTPMPDLSQTMQAPDPMSRLQALRALQTSGPYDPASNPKLQAPVLSDTPPPQPNLRLQEPRGRMAMVAVSAMEGLLDKTALILLPLLQAVLKLWQSGPASDLVQALSTLREQWVSCRQALQAQAVQLSNGMSPDSSVARYLASWAPQGEVWNLIDEAAQAFHAKCPQGLSVDKHTALSQQRSFNQICQDCAQKIQTLLTELRSDVGAEEEGCTPAPLQNLAQTAFFAATPNPSAPTDDDESDDSFGDPVVPPQVDPSAAFGQPPHNGPERPSVAAIESNRAEIAAQLQAVLKQEQIQQQQVLNDEILKAQIAQERIQSDGLQQ